MTEAAGRLRQQLSRLVFHPYSGLLALVVASGVYAASAGGRLPTRLFVSGTVVSLLALGLGLWIPRCLGCTIDIESGTVHRGDTVTFVAAVTNDGWLPAPYVRIRRLVWERRTADGTWSTERTPFEGPVALPPAVSLAGGAERRLTLRGDGAQRGLYRLTRIEVETADPFGWLWSSRPLVDRGRDRLLVLPAVTDLPPLLPATAGPGGRRRPYGYAQGDPSEVRAYQPGDSLKRIHWKLTAHLGEPIVREMDHPHEADVRILLDLHTPPLDQPRHRRAFEAAVDVTASLAAHCHGYQHTAVVHSQKRVVTRVQHGERRSLTDVLQPLAHVHGVPPGADRRRPVFGSRAHHGRAVFLVTANRHRAVQQLAHRLRRSVPRLWVLHLSARHHRVQSPTPGSSDGRRTLQWFTLDPASPLAPVPFPTADTRTSARSGPS